MPSAYFHNLVSGPKLLDNVKFSIKASFQGLYNFLVKDMGFGGIHKMLCNCVILTICLQIQEVATQCFSYNIILLMERNEDASPLWMEGVEDMSYLLLLSLTRTHEKHDVSCFLVASPTQKQQDHFAF